MSEITAELVKKLRDRTNAGFMECKKALTETGGDIEKAIEFLQKSGVVKAAKKADRITAEGNIQAYSTSDNHRGVLVEVNCETDFVAKEERFKQFSKSVAEQAMKDSIKSLENLQQATEEARLALITQLGENISVRRYVKFEMPQGVVGTYVHGTRIGSMVALKKGNLELARDIAMHVAAMNPEYLSVSDVDAKRLEKEKEIFMAQTREEGKPENMLEKIVAGKLKKFASDVSLLAQPFVKDPNKTIEALLKENQAEIEKFVRLEVGEGIEKKQENFAAEVMAQVKG